MYVCITVQFRMEGSGKLVSLTGCHNMVVDRR